MTQALPKTQTMGMPLRQDLSTSFLSTFSAIFADCTRLQLSSGLGKSDSCDVEEQSLLLLLLRPGRLESIFNCGQSDLLSRAGQRGASAAAARPDPAKPKQWGRRISRYHVSRSQHSSNRRRRAITSVSYMNPKEICLKTLNDNYPRSYRDGNFIVRGFKRPAAARPS